MKINDNGKMMDHQKTYIQGILSNAFVAEVHIPEQEIVSESGNLSDDDIKGFERLIEIYEAQKFGDLSQDMQDFLINNTRIPAFQGKIDEAGGSFEFIENLKTILQLLSSIKNQEFEEIEWKKLENVLRCKIDSSVKLTFDLSIKNIKAELAEAKNGTGSTKLEPETSLVPAFDQIEIYLQNSQDTAKVINFLNQNDISYDEDLVSNFSNVAGILYVYDVERFKDHFSSVIDTKCCTMSELNSARESHFGRGRH